MMKGWLKRGNCRSPTERFITKVSSNVRNIYNSIFFV
jgi:hypothetical protein